MTDQRLRKWLVSANNDYRAAQSLLIQPEINLSTLTSYNISMRYPDEFRIPSVTETKNSFEIATIVKQIILSKIEISESDLTLF